MIKIPEHLNKYVEIEEVTGKLLVAKKIPKEHEFEVNLIKKTFEKAMDTTDLSEY